MAGNHGQKARLVTSETTMKQSRAASGSQPTSLQTSQAAQTKAHLLPVGLIALHMAAY